jgi:hypothetical protein
MSEKKKRNWPLWAVAGVAVGVPMLFVVPWYNSTTEQYALLNQYLSETIEDVTPAWDEAFFEPEACVVEGIDWLEACPGDRTFCKGSAPEVVRRCVESQDRAAYCEGLDRSWMTTGFGFHDCEARIEGLEKGDAKKRESVCAGGYRVIADHCRDLELAASAGSG